MALFVKAVGKAKPVFVKPVGGKFLHRERHPMEEADRLLTRLATVTRALFRNVHDQVDLKELSRKLQQHTAHEVMEFLDLPTKFHHAAYGAGVSPHGRSLSEVLREVFAAGAHAEITQLNKVPIKKQTVGADMMFDLQNQRAIDFIDGYVYNLITNISNESKLAIQDILSNAFKEGGHPYQQATLIRDAIGLTRQQAAAASNYRAMLESGDPGLLSQATQRALADGRWDRSVQNAIENETKLPQDMIDRMVAQYEARSLKYRAEMIARTETSRASNAGQQEAWDQAVDQGLLDPKTTRKVWIAADDACADCLAIIDDNEDGVPIDEDFDTFDGPMDGPPAHPNCRCGMALTFD